MNRPIRLLAGAALAVFLGLSTLHAEETIGLDLAALQPGPSGRQRDSGVEWPKSFAFSHVLVVVVVEEPASGKLYYLDPVDLAAGKASARPWLLCLPYRGVIASKQTVAALVKTELQARLRAGLLRAAGEVARSLPAHAAALAPGIVRTVLRHLVGP